MAHSARLNPDFRLEMVAFADDFTRIFQTTFQHRTDISKTDSWYMFNGNDRSCPMLPDQPAKLDLSQLKIGGWLIYILSSE